MKKAIRIAAAAMVLVLLCVSFSACAGTRLKGKWVDDSSSVMVKFGDGGKGKFCYHLLGEQWIDAIEFTYKVSGNKLTMTYLGKTDRFSLKFAKDSVIITDSDGNVWMTLYRYTGD